VAYFKINIVRVLALTFTSYHILTSLQRIFNTRLKKLSLILFCSNFSTLQQKPHDYICSGCKNMVSQKCTVFIGPPCISHSCCTQRPLLVLGPIKSFQAHHNRSDKSSYSRYDQVFLKNIIRWWWQCYHHKYSVGTRRVLLFVMKSVFWRQFRLWFCEVELVGTIAYSPVFESIVFCILFGGMLAWC